MSDLSLIVTPLFNASRGSILLAFLFHLQLINPIWPDAQPYDIFFFWAAALVITVINRKTLFCKTRAVTQVIPPTEKNGMPEDLAEETSP